ncbi:MAG: T9SS type B sorting domain-containing protein, partial [Flavobacteriales bacterium]
VSTYELLRAPTRLSVSSPLSTLSSNEFFAEDYVGDLIDEPGDFCYTILAVDNDMTNGMNGASSNTICLTEDPLVWIPDAFTPNLDQINDWFPWNPGESTLGFISEISANNTSIYKLTILSRWGDVIFESESPDVCWDGTNENEMVPDGVYAVIAQVLDGAGKWHIISKSVQVIRP